MEKKDKIWEKATPIKGKNPKTQRRDDYGNTINKGSYGKNSEQGWNIDHKNPKSKGGTNNIRNLRALQTKENQKKGNKYPYNKKK